MSELQIFRTSHPEATLFGCFCPEVTIAPIVDHGDEMPVLGQVLGRERDLVRADIGSHSDQGAGDRERARADGDALI